MNNKNKNVILTIIEISMLLFVLIGATYAFFRGQQGGISSRDISVTSNTTDLLTFSIDHDLEMTVRQNEFDLGDQNKSAQSTVLASLTPNNNTGEATRNYNMYLNLGNNPIVYSSKNTNHDPELMLQVFDGNNQLVALTGLGTQKTIKGVTGYDITAKKNIIALLSNQEIVASNFQQTIQSWRIVVTLINLDVDQVDNTGKVINGSIIVGETQVQNQCTGNNCSEPGSEDVPTNDGNAVVSSVPVAISSNEFYVYSVGYSNYVESSSTKEYKYSFVINNISEDLTQYDYEVDSYSIMDSIIDYQNYKDFKEQYQTRLTNYLNGNKDAVATAEEMYAHRIPSSNLTINNVDIVCNKTMCTITVDAETHLEPDLNYHETTTNDGSNIKAVYNGIKIKLRKKSVNVVFTDTESISFTLNGTTDKRKINPSNYNNNVTHDAYLKIYYDEYKDRGANDYYYVTDIKICHTNGVCMGPSTLNANKRLLTSKFGEEEQYNDLTTKCASTGASNQDVGVTVCGSTAYPLYKNSSNFIGISVEPVGYTNGLGCYYIPSNTSLGVGEFSCGWSRGHTLYMYAASSSDPDLIKNTTYQFKLADGRIVTAQTNDDRIEYAISYGIMVYNGGFFNFENPQNELSGTAFLNVVGIAPLGMVGHVELQTEAVNDITQSGTIYTPIDNQWYNLDDDLNVISITAKSQACIDAETLVTMADGSLKKLGDIEVGDEVLSVDWDTETLISRKVIYSGKDNYDDWKVNVYWENVFSDGTIIKQAMRHRFYSLESESFVHLHDWKIGLHGYKIDGTNPTLVSRTLVQGEIHYARITLENDNNYFANGLLTGDSESKAGIPLTHFLEKAS